MGKLWEPNEQYDASKPQSLHNMPYKWLDKRLTPEELEELLQDAKRLRWKALDLGYTPISALPDSIGNLTNLQVLKLWGTPISALPDSIGNLTNLQMLSLGYSNISALPDSFANLTNLQVLYLSGTPISALPDFFANLTNLQELRLDDTKISALPDSIANLKKLRRLDLCGCHLKNIPYSVVALGLPFVIDDYFSLRNCVNLTGVTLDEGDLQLFAQPREVIEAYYRDKARAVPQHKAVVTPSAPPVQTPPKPRPVPVPEPPPVLPKPKPKPAPPVPPKPKPAPKPERQPKPTPEPPLPPAPVPEVKPETKTVVQPLFKKKTKAVTQSPQKPPLSELERLKIRNEKLNALYLCLKISLLIAAVGLILFLLLTQRSDLLAELLPWII